MRVLIGFSALAVMFLSACGSPAGPADEDAALPASPTSSAPPAASIEVTAGPAESSPSAPPASEAPPAITLADTVPDGAWNGDDKVIKIKGDVKEWWNPAPKKGDVLEAGEPWVFSSTCTATLCTGKITRSSDEELPARDFTWDGTKLTLTRPAWAGEPFECLTDNKKNGAMWEWERTWSYKIDVETDADGKVVVIHSETKVGAHGLETNSKEMCGTGPKSGSYTIRSEMKPVS